jgi:tRNA threonylcarbamoyladenosine biosynthesis protein TsaB
MMLILDTSTDKSLVIFADGMDICLKILLPPGVQSSRYLMQEVEKGFKHLDKTPKDLKVIGVGIGPGSYTGIRVGVAAAKGLAFPYALPLIGFCSLEGFVTSHEGRFASLIDARQGGGFVLLQERQGENLISHLPPRLIPPQDLPTLLTEWPPLAGPHVSYPDPAQLIHLVQLKLAAGHGQAPLELLYLRSPVIPST